MAQIIQFTNSASAPVQQKLSRGRHPKKVVNLYRFRSDKNVSQRCKQMAQGEAETLRGVIKTCEQVIHNTRYELAVLTKSIAERKS